MLKHFTVCRRSESDPAYGRDGLNRASVADKRPETG
jgi:hypothetical protein